MIYLYESHLGGCYISREEISIESLYCDQCGDYDRLFAKIQTGGDLLDAIADMMNEGYILEYIEEISADIGIPIIMPGMSSYTDSDYMYLYEDENVITAKCSLFDDICYKWRPLEDTIEDAEYIDCDYCTKRFERDLRELNPDIAAILDIEELIQQ